MWRTLRWCLAIMIMHAAVAREVRREAPADWIMAPAGLTLETGAVAGEGELEYLIVDRQINVGTQEDFTASWVRVRAEGGLQDAGNWSVSFDPAYEVLTVHALKIHRDGAVIDRLPAAEFRLMERETQADRHIYDGQVTALTLLPDVRVGDVVEFAYTIRGRNPVFGGHFFGRFGLGWSQPVRQQRLRILEADNSSLQYRLHGPVNVEPKVVTHGSDRVLEWRQTDVPPYVEEDDTPAWHASYPWAEVTEFADWRAVIDWALPLYVAASEAPAPDLQAVVDAAPPDDRPEARILHLLDFVQREIRYLGIELGESSHQPHPPEVTFERRFGDCKDKATVLVQLLRAAGFDAFPVLVNSYAGERLSERLPSPGTFDHVIVGLRWRDRTWWFDATEAPQPGRLEHRSAADFGFVLPVAEGVRELVRMSVPPASARRIVSVETIRSRAFDAPAEMEVRTEYFGASAASIWSSLTQRSAGQTRQNYEEYYHSVYPEIRMTAPVTWERRDEDGTVVVTERYEVSNFWRQQEDGRREMEVFPLLIDGYLPRGIGARRTSPRHVTHPVQAELTLRLELPEPWELEPEEVAVADAAFDFRLRSAKTAPNQLEFRYTYQSAAGHVPAERMGEYVEKVKQARANLGYVFTKHPPTAPAAAATDGAAASTGTGPNVWMFLVAMAAFGVAGSLGGLWTWFEHRRPPPLPDPGAPTGIGGWLILPLLGLIFSVVAMPVTFVRSFGVAFERSLWLALTGPESTPADHLLAAQVVFEVVGNVVLWVAAVFVLVLFLCRHRAVPRFICTYFIAAAGFYLLDAVWTSTHGRAEASDVAEAWGLVLRQVIGAIIWVAYFRRSRRVRNTFSR